MTTEQKKYAAPSETPPSDTKRIYQWTELSNRRKAATYVVETEGQKPRMFTASHHKRQVLEGLMRWPILAASYCRISDQVLLLRRDCGLEIICTVYPGDPVTGREKYGVYSLASDVRCVDGEATQ